MKRSLLSFALIALFATRAWAPLHSQRRDTLDVCTASCSTFNSTHMVDTQGAKALIMQLSLTGTISAEVQNSIDQGSTWSTVSGGSCVNCSDNFKVSIDHPVGWYRWAGTACSSCTYTTRYQVDFTRTTF